MHTHIHGLRHTGKKLSQAKRSYKNMSLGQGKHRGTDQGGRENEMCQLSRFKNTNSLQPYHRTDNDCRCTSRPFCVTVMLFLIRFLHMNRLVIFNSISSPLAN